MKLKSLQIKNFQSHSDTRIDFADGITVIIGNSNVGKTSLLRAMDWLRLNRPRGLSFLRNGTKEVQVVLETSAGVIGRLKSKTKNRYWLRLGSEGEGEEQIFDVVGNDVPREVQNLLQLSDLNVHRQFDPHYLLFESPGQIAQVINQACRLDKGIAAVDVLASRLRRLKQEKEIADDELSVVEEQLLSPEFTTLPSVNKKIEQAEKIAARLEERAQRLDRLRTLLIKLGQVDREYLRLERIVKPSRKLLKRAETLATALLERKGLLGQLTRLIGLRSEVSAFLERSGAIRESAELFGEAETIGESLRENRRDFLELRLICRRWDEAVERKELAFVAHGNAVGNLTVFIQENPSCQECGAPLNEKGEYDNEATWIVER